MADPQMMIPLRKCGHPRDAFLFCGNRDGKIEIYCMPCLFEKLGIPPAEVLTPEEFMRRYGGKK